MLIFLASLGFGEYGSIVRLRLQKFIGTNRYGSSLLISRSLCIRLGLRFLVSLLSLDLYIVLTARQVFSRYFILKAAPSPSQQNSSQRTWFKGIAHTISSRFTPRTRTYFSRSGRSYDEISIGLSSAKQPRTESLEKLDAVPLGQVSEKAINSDPEQGKTMWVSANSVSRADSVDSRV